MFRFFRKQNKKIRIKAKSITPIFHKIRLHVQDRMVKKDPEANHLDFFLADDAARVRWFKEYAGVEIEIDHPKSGKFEIYFVFNSQSEYTMFLLKWS